MSAHVGLSAEVTGLGRVARPMSHGFAGIENELLPSGAVPGGEA
jgi:hypothetical protein